MPIERELMPGAGPVAVLQLLEHGEMYGYQLVEAVSRNTDGVLAMGQWCDGRLGFHGSEGGLRR